MTDEEEKMSGPVITVIGAAFLAAMVLVPLVLMICGTFWNWK